MTTTRRFFIVFVALISVFSYAKPKSAPLPEAAYKASSVYIVNHTGNQEVGDAAVDEFPKTKRFKVVNNRASADLIATFEHAEFQIKGNTHTLVEMSITLPASDDPIYQTTPRPFGFHTPAGLARHCITDFEELLDKK